MKISNGYCSLGALLVFTVICIPGSAASESAAGKGIIRGTVTYGGPVANIKVALSGPVKKEEKTDERGQFSFKDLPSGDYTLEAKGIAKNNRRKGTAEATVADPPAEVEITIKLE
jgi:hypothetical protein